MLRLYSLAVAPLTPGMKLDIFNVTLLYFDRQTFLSVGKEQLFLPKAHALVLISQLNSRRRSVVVGVD